MIEINFKLFQINFQKCAAYKYLLYNFVTIIIIILLIYNNYNKLCILSFIYGRGLFFFFFFPPESKDIPLSCRGP